MEKSIIKLIAKQNGVKVSEVKRDMREAINAAYINPNAAALSVPRKGSVPTPEEIVSYCVHMVRNQLS